MSKKCPKCGKKNDDVASFCANCGYSFNSDFNNKEVENSKNLSITIENNGSKSTIRLPSLKTILAILILLIILVLVVSNQVGHLNHNDNDSNNGNNITLIKENVKGQAYLSEGKPVCYYHVDGVLKNLPNNIEGYDLKGTFYDENGKYIGENNAYMKFVKEDSDRSELSTLVSCYTNGVKNLSYVELEMTGPNGNIIFNKTLNYDMEKMDLSKVEGFY